MKTNSSLISSLYGIKVIFNRSDTLLNILIFFTISSSYENVILIKPVSETFICFQYGAGSLIASFI